MSILRDALAAFPPVTRTRASHTMWPREIGSDMVVQGQDPLAERSCRHHHLLSLAVNRGAETSRLSSVDEIENRRDSQYQQRRVVHFRAKLG